MLCLRTGGVVKANLFPAKGKRPQFFVARSKSVLMHGAYARWQSIQADETSRIGLVVKSTAFFKRRDVLPVKAIWACSAGNSYGTLVKLEGDFSRGCLGHLLHKRIHRFAERIKPAACVHEFSVLQYDYVFHLHALPVKSEGLKLTTGRCQDSASRSLVNPPDFIPTRRFSTMSMRPTPCSPPTSFNCSRRVAGESLLPLYPTGRPLSI